MTASKFLDNPKWRKKCHSLPCELSGRETSTVPAHLRLDGAGGTAIKPGDDCIIPIDNEFHQAEHGKGWMTTYMGLFTRFPLFLKRCLMARAREIYRQHYADEGEAILLDAIKILSRCHATLEPEAALDSALFVYKKLYPEKDLWWRPK